VVSTASHEAREFGVGSGMPLRIAARKAPEAVILAVDGEAYTAASASVMATLRAQPGATLQVLGWDEAFIGVQTEDPVAYAGQLQKAVPHRRSPWKRGAQGQPAGQYSRMTRPRRAPGEGARNASSRSELCGKSVEGLHHQQIQNLRELQDPAKRRRTAAAERSAIE
jgi:hypothetical protein